MSDPSTNDVTEPRAAPQPPPPPAAVEPAAKGWRDRRVPWVVAGAAVLLACLLGAGAATIGAVVIGHSGQDDRGPGQIRDRDGRPFPGGQNYGGHDDRRGDGGRAPVPSGSAVPTPS